MSARDLRGTLYDAINTFQLAAQLSSLQHAQMRQHLAEHLDNSLRQAGYADRAEVLREAADAADCLTRENASTPTTTMGAAWYDGLNAAVQMLYREADAAGKDTPAGGESTRDDADTCGRCRRPFDPADTRFDGRARYRETPFCRGCVDTCHDSTDPFHRCPVCTAGGEPRA